jgi:integrase
MKRQGSSFGQFRQRIPLDVRDRVRSTTVDIPLGRELVSKRISPTAVEIALSLRSRDPSEIRERTAVVAAHLERVYRALRNETPAMALTHRAAVQLSREFYQGWCDESRDAPALVYELAGTYPGGPVTSIPVLASTFPDPSELHALWDAIATSATVSEHSLSPLVDRFLLGKGLKVTEASRETLLVEVERALRDAFANRRRNASGDYSPDPNASRFPPPWQPSSETLATLRRAGSNPRVAEAKGRLPLKELIESWRTHPEQEYVAQSTVASYRYTAEALAAFLKGSGRPDDARQITRQVVHEFTEHRMNSGIKAKTVRDSDLSCLKALFGFAAAKGMLSSNPAQGLTIKVRLGPQKRRKKDFDDAEAQAILTHASSYRPIDKRESPKLSAAKRWVPWLCAYSGTRVGEMAQLRKQDIAQGNGIWTITISHEAGTQKRKATWNIPLHPHLIEMGFLEFVRESADGHLFLTPRPDRYRPYSPESRTKDPNGILGPLQGVKNRLREFVREIVTRPDVQPNHGWRHRFKSVAIECGIEKRVRDAFALHEGETVSDDYGEVTVRTMLGALERMPRYSAVGG